MEKKILVTGGTGAIGAHLLYYLTLGHKNISATHRPSSDLKRVKEVFAWHNPEKADQIFNKIIWIETDLLNRLDVYDAVSDANIVFHLGAQVNFQGKDQRELIFANTDMSTFVVDACLEFKIDKLVYMSSIASLGKAGNDGQIDESCIWNSSKGKSAYSISKFQSETEVWRGIEEGLKAVMINPSIVVGPMMGNTSSGKLVSSIKKGWPFYSEGITGYVDVRDVCQIMIQLMDEEILSERFILNEGNYSFEFIFNTIADKLKKGKPKIKFTKKLGLIFYYIIWPLNKIGLVKNLFTKASINIFISKRNYNSKKVKERLNHSFIPITDSLELMVQTHH